MHYIRKCDYLYNEAKFTFNDKGETGQKTIFGGIISIITIVISLSLTGYFIYRLLKKKDSSIILSTESDPYINITYSHRMPFLVRFSDSYSVPYKNQTSRLYNVYLRLWYGGSNNSENENDTYQSFDEIKVSQCNINEHFGEYKEYFKDIPNIDSYYCPDLRQYNQTIYGIYGGTKPFSYLHFYFARCLNETMNNTCFNDDYIEKILSGLYLDVIYIGFNMNSLKQNAVQTEIKSERFLVSNSVYKRIWIFINKIYYITDDGIIFANEKKEMFHLYDNIRSDVDIRDTKKGNIPGAFLTLSILNNGEVSIYRRKYLKLKDYMATIGGIVKVISLVGSLINYYNGINSYYFHIIKHFMIENKIRDNTSKTLRINENNAINNSTSQYNNNKSFSKMVKKINNFYPIKITEMDNKTINIINKKEIIKNNENNEILLYNNFFYYLLPPIFFGRNEKEKYKNLWYFENINKRLNIIHFLKLLKKNDDLFLMHKSNTYNKIIGNTINSSYH